MGVLGGESGRVQRAVSGATRAQLLLDGADERLPKAPSAVDCGARDGWHYDDESAPTVVHACPSTCARIQAAQSANVDILFGCDTELIPPELDRIGGFRTISFKEIRDLLSQQALRTELGCEDDAQRCLAEIGGSLGVQYLISGSITLLDGTYLIQLETSGEVLARTKVTILR